MAGETGKNQPVKPYKLPGDKSKPASSRVSTLPYRLQGMSYGLAAGALYCHFILHAWSKYLLLASLILGYFIGWLVGYISVNKK